MTHEETVLVFGEVLIDRFDDGLERRGGAPFNVAWHLRGFGEDPVLISRVGTDRAGRRLIDDMNGWGMRTVGIQLDDERPTGYVSVFNQKTSPTFEIHADVAYDRIDPDEIDRAVLDGDYRLLYHGSLALRMPVSKSAFDAVLGQNGDTPVFFDVNLRPPWWSAEQIHDCLKSTTYLKCNESELMTLIDRGNGEHGDTVAAARKMQMNYELESVIVTRGENGAFLCDRDGDVRRAAPLKAPAVHSTVGAGDAFSAVMILGIIHDWQPGTALRRASDFAASICGIDGAVPDSIEFYRRIQDGWS